MDHEVQAGKALSWNMCSESSTGTGEEFYRVLTEGAVWRVDPGWRPGAHQSRSITPLLSCTGERKYNER